MIIEDHRYNFSVMLKNKLVARCEIINKHYHITINPNIPKPLQVFAMKNPNDYHVYQFLKSRCYDDSRADLKEILEKAGMKNNNPFEWCKLTHGFVYGDYYWIKFDNEKISWEEVRK